MLPAGKVLFHELFSIVPELIIAVTVAQRTEPVFFLFAAELWPLRPEVYKQLDSLQDFGLRRFPG